MDSTQNIVKIITNSTSYGIFVEINTAQSKGSKVTVHGNGPDPFTETKDKVETFGSEFNPLIATFITSASRLVLAITESILSKHGAVYAFCDTDSMAIPPEHVAEVQAYFQGLSPYSFKDPLFKLEKENYGPDGKLKPLWFYGISAKRYSLYNMVDGKLVIRKYSSHGLGHLLDPFARPAHTKQAHVCTDSSDMGSNHVEVTTSNDLVDLPNDLPIDLPNDLPVSTSSTTCQSTSILHAHDPFDKLSTSSKHVKMLDSIPVNDAICSNDRACVISSPPDAQSACKHVHAIQAPQAPVQATLQAQAPSPRLKPLNQAPEAPHQAEWHEEIWADILNLEYGFVSRDDLEAKYASSYAISKMAITSPHILKLFKSLNKGKHMHMQIKPFNFMLVGVANHINPQGQLVKPIAPYCKDPQRIVYEDFVDYHSGAILNGLQYWKPFGSVFWDYLDHKESKFDGDRGILTRKHLMVKRIVHIGKESDNLEETVHLGVGDDAYQIYAGGSGKGKLAEDLREFILSLKPQTAKKFGIAESTLKRWKRQIRIREPFEIYGKTGTNLKRAMQRGTGRKRGLKQ